MAGQWKICSPDPWVHVGFRVKFQQFPSLLLEALYKLSFERQTSLCTLGNCFKIHFCIVLKLGSRLQLEI